MKTIFDFIKDDKNISDSFKDKICGCGGKNQITFDLQNEKMQSICLKCGKLVDLGENYGVKDN